MKKWMTIMFVCFCFEGFAQTFYAVTGNADDTSYNSTYQLSINNCDTTRLYTCFPSDNNNDDYEYFDIAIDTSGNLYYLSGIGGALYTRKLNNVYSCQYLGRFAGDSDLQALTCDVSGNVFVIGTNGFDDSTEFYEYKSATKTFLHLGFLPSDFATEGDIFFYEGRLFLTAISISRKSSVLVEVNIKNPSQSCFYMDLGQMHVYSAFSIQNGNCSDAYVFDTKATGSTLYKLDLVNKTISQPLCTYPFQINGAASIYKFSPSIIDSSNCTNVENNCVAMPVTFINFTSTLLNNSVKLQWQTASEINSNYFSIERSSDGINFSSIGKMNAAGTSNSIKQYSFTDNNPQSINYYRLKEVDLDGKFTYSNILLVKTSQQINVSVSPNPATDRIFISASSSAQKIEIIDPQGVVVLVKNNVISREPVFISSLARGIYFLKAYTTDGIVVKEFVKE